MTMTEEEAKYRVSALPAKLKGTVKKPVRPDFAERDTKVSKLLDKAQEFQKRSKDITRRLDDIHNASRSNTKQENLKRELADLRHKKQQLQKRRENARAKLQEITSMANGKSAVKKSMQVASTEDIAAAMESLQRSLNTTSDEEQQRKIVDQIQKLHVSYEQVSGGKAALGSEHNDKLKAQLAAEIATCTAELEQLTPSEDSARARLDQMQAEQQASEPDIQALRTERDQCSEIVSQLRDKVTELRDDWQEKFATFKEQMELWKNEQDELRVQRDAFYVAEREQRSTERKERDLEVMGPPFTEEILRCEQLLNWCQKYQTAESQNVVKANIDAPVVLDGFVVRVKVSKEDEGNIAFSKSKNKKKGGSGRKSVPSGVPDAKSTKVLLDMDALALFAKLQLSVPSTVAGVEELAVKVAAKKAEYLDKQKRALAGEIFAEEKPETSKKVVVPKAAKDTVVVEMRSDEAFGTVLLELVVG